MLHEVPKSATSFTAEEVEVVLPGNVRDINFCCRSQWQLSQCFHGKLPPLLEQEIHQPKKWALLYYHEVLYTAYDF
jgi:hypothetical protein